MSSEKKKEEKKMDPRCPRKLEHLPTSFCPLAVLRLRQLRLANRELTEEEEDRLGGCKWHINHQNSCYCFFKYASDYLSQDRALSEVEIAHMTSVSLDSVKKIEKVGLEKMRQAPEMKEIKDNFNQDNIIEGEDIEDDEHHVSYNK